MILYILSTYYVYKRPQTVFSSRHSPDPNESLSTLLEKNSILENYSFKR